MVAFNTLNTAGIDYSVVFSLNTQTVEYPNPPFIVGTISEGSAGTEYVYVQGTTAVSANGVVVIDQTYTATALANASTVLFDQPVGVVPVAVAAISGTITKQYFWVARKGYVPILTAAAVAVNAQLRSTATAGAIDDVAAGATTYPITGMVLTTAAAAAGSALGYLNYPLLGALNT